jgi:hypothetical protein
MPKKQRRLKFPIKYEALQQYLNSFAYRCYPGELELKGEVHPFVDMSAYKNGDFWAFEYKSFADPVKKGIEQCIGYARWFHYVTLVTERNLTPQSKYYGTCKELGFGILFRRIDGRWVCKLDSRLQKPPKENLEYVFKKFATEPTFIEILGTVRVPRDSKSDELYDQMQQKAATVVDKIANLLSPETLNLYVSIWHTGTFVEPRKKYLIVFSSKPFGVPGHIDTYVLKEWTEVSEIVWVIDYPGDDPRWKAVEQDINGKIRKVAEILGEEDRNQMTYNIVRDLGYCQSGMYPKEKEITKILEDVRGKRMQQ